MFILSFNAAHYFRLKKIIYFLSFFSSNARKSCAPFIEIFFPHDKFLLGKILTRNPLPRATPTPTLKSPPENVCKLHNNHYYM